MNKLIKKTCKAFTLIEVMIVIVIMSILATVIINQMANSTTDAKDSVLRENLNFVRRQIYLYKVYHSGNCPPIIVDPVYGTTLDMDYDESVGSTKALFLSSGSSEFETVAFTEMPPNPFSHGRAIQTSTDPFNETVDHSLTISGENVGWFYNPSTGELTANAEGSTTDGVLRSSL